MLELNAAKFLDTMGEVRRVKTVIDQFDESGRTEMVVEAIRTMLASNFQDLEDATLFVGAEVSAMAAGRMKTRLNDPLLNVTMGEIRDTIEDVESRLRDECQLVSFVILNRNQKNLFSDANQLVGWDILAIFPDAARELEESAKCLALQRPTASVFHSMRILEIGIQKIAEILDIPNPIKPADRNWGIILSKIKEKIDNLFPSKRRLPNSDGAAFETLYASLDAVKNPWRNNTMHVESFYTDAEAQHILNCVVFFMRTLATRCTPLENGA
ncbi:hypothetical protein WHT83_02125 [Aminobacter sp. P9b]|uniref:hypothetical protein n=1 Tax=Aminobacter sp. P9b TaxID=3133697 RepID=UPI00324D2ED0